MSLQLLWTHRASAELSEAFEWWATNRSAAEAKNWHAGLREAVERLPANPRSHSLAQDYSTEHGLEIRVALFGLGRSTTHRIVYAVDDESVTILCIRHVSRDDLTLSDFDL